MALTTTENVGSLTKLINKIDLFALNGMWEIDEIYQGWAPLVLR